MKPTERKKWYNKRIAESFREKNKNAASVLFCHIKGVYGFH